MADGVKVDGLRIAQARQALPRDTDRPVSQAKFAEMVGLHVVTVSNLERGKQRRASLNTLDRIAQVTGKPIEYFLADRTPPSPPEHSLLADAFESVAEMLLAAAREARDHSVTRPAAA